MNEAKDQARVRDTKINVALYNAATDYAEYVMSDRSNYDEAMRLASALEAAAVAYAKIAGGEKPEAVQNAGNIAGSISATGSVAAHKQSIWLEYKHATPPQAIVKGYEREENECVAELLKGIPSDGGSATKANFENLVRMAFMGGLAAIITRKQ